MQNVTGSKPQKRGYKFVVHSTWQQTAVHSEESYIGVKESRTYKDQLKYRRNCKLAGPSSISKCYQGAI